MWGAVGSDAHSAICCMLDAPPPDRAAAWASFSHPMLTLCGPVGVEFLVSP